MTIHAITVPKWGIEMQEATLSEWKVDVGGTVDKGDEIVDLETDKIVNTHEAPASGTLRRILADVGDVYDVGVLLGVLSDAGESEEEIDAFVESFVPVDASFDGSGSAEAEPESAPEPEAPAPTPAAAPATGGRVRISPIAKRLAEANGLDYTSIVGTGRNGRISKEDVEAALAAQGAGQPIKRSGMQKTVASRMQAAKQAIPHFYLDIDIECDAAQALRADYNRANDCKVTLNDVLMRAVAVALKDSSSVNVVLKDDELYPADDGVGVAIAAPDGLVAPVLKDVARSDLKTISIGVRRLANAAKERTLEKDDITGGATTVSNLGMFGVDGFTAIINPPQTSIIAVGRASQQAIVRDGELAVATIMRVTLSCDHRAFDGAAGAAFLGKLKETLESPAQLFD
ncbi:MAG: dihydrolipoamide acetyltransferase family protein [Woeseiaceae bacterium]|nr:dihydrolipoamide acetyltransferase family protein [Woeseiaceae bacterium]